MDLPQPTLDANLVFGRFPSWSFTLWVIASVEVLLFLHIWLISPRISKQRARRQHRRLPQNERGFHRSLTMSLWLTLVGVCGITWIYTIWLDSPFRSLIYAAGFSALVLTYFLEGLEIAVTDLSDKDKSQFSGSSGERFAAIKEDKFFYESREWAIISLLIAASLMIERTAYHVPGIVDINDGDHGATLARIIITIVLTTCPFVWVAQSPGKEVALSNSVAFLNYDAPWLIFRVLRRFAPLVRWSGIHYPSEAGEDLAFTLMKKCREKRDLPTSEFRLFADGLKGYGYGILWAEDSMAIGKDGSCEVRYRSLAYVGMPRHGIPREVSFEEGFSDIWDGQNKKPQVSAFLVDPIQEKVDDKLIEEWKGLFDSTDPAEWVKNKPGYRRVDTAEWLERYRLKSQNGMSGSVPQSAHVDQRPLKTLNITLDFRGDTPEEGQAMVVMWVFTIRMNPNTILLPKNLDCSEMNDYFKRYSYPSLRSTFVISLPSNFFARDLDYAVTYEGIEHEQEIVRFKNQQKQATILSEDRKMITIRVNSPLPASTYKVKWYIERIASLEESEPKYLPQPTTGDPKRQQTA